MADSGTYTPETLARRAKMAEALITGNKNQPIRNWVEGAGNLSENALGYYMLKNADDEQRAGDQKSREFIASMLMGGPAASGGVPGPQSAAEPAGAAPMGGLPGMANSIAGIESGGKYDALGPVTKTGDRAYGKYQVMGANVPEWTKTHLGQPMTPDEFIKNPEAQDKVFNGQFGQYASKYGPEGAAKAWFAGEGGMNNPNAKDVLGTSVSDYANKFRTAALGNGVTMGGPAPAPAGQQMAQANIPNAPGGGNPMTARIVEALRSKDPYIARAAQGMAGPIIAKQFSPPEFSRLNDEQLYDKNTGKVVGAGVGYKPLVDPTERAKFGIDPTDKRPYQVGPGNKLINPPAETRFNVDQRGEGAYEQQMGKHLADFNIELPKSASQARNKIATLDRLSSLVSDPNVQTGKAADAILEAKRLAKLVGIDVGDVGPAEAARAISNQFALELRNPSGGAGMPGAMSDKDREFLQAIVPGLQQNPEGNKLITDYLKRVAQRSIDVERLRQQYVRKNKRLDEGFFTELADYGDANPLFTDADKPSPAQGAPAAPKVRKFNPATGVIE